jgi:SAM-dependent methyltransferase
MKDRRKYSGKPRFFGFLRDIMSIRRRMAGHEFRALRKTVMDRKQHWEHVYTSKTADSVSWFQPRAGMSLQLIHDTGLGKDAAIIDVGGGASNLVDALLAEGYSDLTVLDLSAAAIEVSRQRLGVPAKTVQWVVADITRAEFSKDRFDLWHDRATFHFLTKPAERQAYIVRLMHALRSGGHLILATFAEDGPEKCSGLPVMRYSPKALGMELGNAFELIRHEKEAHLTPSGAVQQFSYCCFRRT